MASEKAYQGFRWMNEPASWSAASGLLQFETAAESDFWNETHYGFTHDSGHLYFKEIEGPFTAQVRVRAELESLYDQAGLMVWIDSMRWVKFGVEMNDGRPYISVVVTDRHSDWSTGAFLGDVRSFWLRLTLSAGVMRAQVSYDGVHWPLVRLAPFQDASILRVGPMACSPKRGGLKVFFSAISISLPNGKGLHDLS